MSFLGMSDELNSKLKALWVRSKLNGSSTESTDICDSIRNSTSIPNISNGRHESSHDWNWSDLQSDGDYRTAYRRERSNTIAINTNPRPLTNKIDSSDNYNSLPNQSILNENRKLTIFDTSIHFNRENANSDSIYPNDRPNDYRIHNPNLVDFDQKTLNSLARDILKISNLNRDENNEEIRTNPQNDKHDNNRREHNAQPNTMHKTLNDASFSFSNHCQIGNSMFTGSLGLGCSLYFNDQIWNPKIWNPMGELPDRFQSLIDKYQLIAKKVEASYTWSGQLPKRNRNKNPIYSCKVFLGGIPYDLTDSDLHLDFARFGPIQIQWPAANVKSAIEGAAANKAGYVYVVFESYDSVAALLNTCTVSYKDLDSGCRWYFNMNSRRTKMKEVQVIPFDIGDRFYMKSGFHGQMDHSKTVFVGALHGMLSADGLAKVMEDLFGGVIFAGLDTDKHKYPLGSGRVSFDNNDSYMKAVSAAFVEIKSSRFKKKIQIDPYIENESICYSCKVPQQSPVFCRDITCLQYYCRNCWDVKHSDEEFQNHRPIIKNKIK